MKLKPNDMTMEVGFRTHCRRCGTPWYIKSELCVPAPEAFEHCVRKMRESLEKTRRECCGHKLPKIGKQWESLWAWEHADGATDDE